MDNSYSLSNPMVVRLLDINTYPFLAKRRMKSFLVMKVLTLMQSGVVMYLANNTRPDICFAVSLLTRLYSSPTTRPWKCVKHILCYLRGTMDIGLFYSNESKLELIGYADAQYLCDPHNAQSQTCYLFTCGDMEISWRSIKQTLVTTFSNHEEIIVIHEASLECVLFRSMTHHFQEMCGFSLKKSEPTTMYENYAACIDQLKGRYIKG